MIQATRLNGSSIYLNPEIIETIEKTPDTIITLTSGKKYVVKEDIEELSKRFIKYQQFVRRPFNQKAADAQRETQ